MTSIGQGPGFLARKFGWRRADGGLVEAVDRGGLTSRSKRHDGVTARLLKVLRPISRRIRETKYRQLYLRGDVQVVTQSGLFDCEWYLQQYQDVAALGQDPIVHYLQHGALEGRDPSAAFSTLGYLEAYADVRASRVNPLLHYIKHGRAEGRDLSQGDYKTWVIKHDTLSDEDLIAFRNALDRFPARPLISIVMPVYNSDCNLLELAIQSVLEQMYPNWELCVSDDCSTNPRVKKTLEKFARSDARIKVHYREENGHISANSNSALALASGEFVALMDHDDELAAQALFWFVEEIIRYPEADILFCDEDKLDDRGQRFDALFKPDWNPAMITSQNYVCHMTLYRRSLVQRAGGFRIGFEGSQDHDLVLRCSELTVPEKIRHIPRILYHWRAAAGSTASEAGLDAKPYAWQAGARAIQEHLDRRGIAGTVAVTANQYYRIEYAPLTEQPRVSVIIPTTWNPDLVRTCLLNILKETTYSNVEFVITSNEKHVQAAEKKEIVEMVRADPRVKIITYADRSFNYSRTNNEAIGQTDAPIICLLNDDVSLISRDWLEQLVVRVMLDDVGAVGPMLYYPHDQIQHAGVLLGIGGVAGHQFQHLPRGSPGYFSRAKIEQDLSCVTAACLVLRREAFDGIGGFDEGLEIAFNDVDLCIRLRNRGWRIIWTPHVEMYHHESASLGPHNSDDRREQFGSEVALMRKRWAPLLDNDPFYNPNLSLSGNNFTLAFPPRISRLPVVPEALRGAGSAL